MQLDRLELNRTQPGGDTRPLSARSIVASTLLGLARPALPISSLLRAGEAFDIAHGTTRVAVSRMLRAGELTTNEIGAYALSGRLLERHARQQESRLPVARGWTGHWETAIVRGTGRDPQDRADLRRAASLRRLAEVREGVWVRPANLDPARQPGALATLREQCALGRTSFDDETSLAGELWDLGNWSRVAASVIELLHISNADMRVDARTLRHAFECEAAALRHVQRDPLLPAGLLPADWPAAQLRETLDLHHETFNRAWRTWLRNDRS